MPKAIAIIPARGGSKRIPLKNIRLFAGAPIIKFSIDAAIQSGCFNEIMVSTDELKISEVAQSYGAKVPFLRDSPTASDHASLEDVVKEVLLNYQAQNLYFDYACCILPTAPFINSKRIEQGFDLLKTKKADSVVTVTRFSYPIQRALVIDTTGKLKMMYPENVDCRSQDLQPTFHDCGQFYWIHTESFLKQVQLFAANCIPLEIPETEMQDIDSDEDWKIAELKFQLLQNKAQVYS